jgi:hypothetical protein
MHNMPQENPDNAHLPMISIPSGSATIPGETPLFSKRSNTPFLMMNIFHPPLAIFISFSYNSNKHAISLNNKHNYQTSFRLVASAFDPFLTFQAQKLLIPALFYLLPAP